MALRLFIALHLGRDNRERLSRIQATLRAADRVNSVRWVEPESIHLTLRFLGDTEEFAVPDLVRAVGAVAALRGGALRLDLGGLGGFPNLDRPRVIWVGLEGDLEGLVELQGRVESAVVASGWGREVRAFQPHLTLGRLRDPRRQLDRSLKNVITSLRTNGDQSPVRRLSLVRSDLGPQGSRYEDIATWDLDT